LSVYLSIFVFNSIAFGNIDGSTAQKQEIQRNHDFILRVYDNTSSVLYNKTCFGNESLAFSNLLLATNISITSKLTHIDQIAFTTGNWSNNSFIEQKNFLLKSSNILKAETSELSELLSATTAELDEAYSTLTSVKNEFSSIIAQMNDELSRVNNLVSQMQSVVGRVRAGHIPSFDFSSNGWGFGIKINPCDYARSLCSILTESLFRYVEKADKIDSVGELDTINATVVNLTKRDANAQADTTVSPPLDVPVYLREAAVRALRDATELVNLAFSKEVSLANVVQGIAPPFSFSLVGLSLPEWMFSYGFNFDTINLNVKLINPNVPILFAIPIILLGSIDVGLTVVKYCYNEELLFNIERVWEKAPQSLLVCFTTLLVCSTIYGWFYEVFFAVRSYCGGAFRCCIYLVMGQL
jgi:hypothetical protein